ncbi:MAG: hypothetical protein H5U38_09360 [Calditrichaeota bacterium]|nr:hypothetical protein [Calditrichota bacterium]
MLTIVLCAIGSLLLLYIVRDYLCKLVTFICDHFLGKVVETVTGWLQPAQNSLRSMQANLGGRIELGRLLGSFFLFAVTLAFAAANYVLIFFGMELLLPSEGGLGVQGLSAASLASIVVVLVEVLLGFFLLELSGLTDLTGWHKLPKNVRLAMGGLLALFLVILVFAEAGIALYRIYQVTGTEAEPSHGLARVMARLPYWVTFFLTVVVPIATALSAFSLRDILLVLGWVVATALRAILEVVLLFMGVLHAVITRIDDFLSALLSVLTYVVEVVASVVVFLLVKMKLLRVLAVVAILVLAQGCTGKCDNPVEPVQRGRFVVALVDNSGSFSSYLPRAISNCKCYIDSLDYGDAFTLILIGSESLEEKEPPFIGTTWLPRPSTHIVPRDLRARVAAQKARLKARADSIIGLPRSPDTDLAGAIIRAARFMSPSVSGGYAAHLLIFSDMRDTKRRNIPKRTRLEGVWVRVLFVDILDQQVQERVDRWCESLRQMGAREVRVLTPDQCEGLRNYRLPLE